MHPALMKGPLFYKKNIPHFPFFTTTPHFPLFYKKHSPHFISCLQACDSLCVCVCVYTADGAESRVRLWLHADPPAARLGRRRRSEPG